MGLKNSSVAERQFIGKESAACLPSSYSVPKPKIKHHHPQSQTHLTVEIPYSSSPHPSDLRRGGGSSCPILSLICRFSRHLFRQSPPRGTIRSFSVKSSECVWYVSTSDSCSEKVADFFTIWLKWYCLFTNLIIKSNYVKVI